MRIARAARSPWLPAARLKAAGLLAATLLCAGASITAAATPAPTTAPTAAPTPARPPGNASRLSHGRFHDVLVYAPPGTPASFALLLSGDEGWTPTTDTMARQLVQQGAMVVGIDWPKFKAVLDADAAECVFPDGDLENLSHFVQAYFHAPNYLPPILVGLSSGGTVAYAMLAQAPRNTFAAALTLGFCPNLDLDKPLCKGSALDSVRSTRSHGVDLLPAKSLGNPWVDLQSDAGETCPATTTRDFLSKVRGAAMVALPKAGRGFASLPGWIPQYSAAYNELSTENPTTHVAPPPAGLSDLPVVEIPARAPTAPGGRAAGSDAFAIIMSGDGGWAGLDQDVAGALSAQGIPVVGLDSLRYYWTARTPTGLAADTDRMIRYYLAHFNKRRVLLIGYSQGADVLPFAVNRLSPDTRARVALAAVMGMSEHALFEFHLTSWVSDDNSGLATLPEIERISGVPVLCIYGADETDSLCPKLDPKKFAIVKLKGGHHFDGDYAALARQILASVNP
jgi:type IV secretory pathway VirJ component